MPNVGWTEMLVILTVALIVFGPNRLPELARNIGKFVRNFQRETSSALAELREGIEPVRVGAFDTPDRPTPAPPGEPDAVAPVRVPATRPPTRRAARKTVGARKAPARTKSAAAKRTSAKSKAKAKARPKARATGTLRSTRRK